MNTSHALKYHVALPAALFVGLLVIGVPVGTAIFLGMMAGCLSMMLMMAGPRRDDRKLEEPDHG